RKRRPFFVWYSSRGAGGDPRAADERDGDRNVGQGRLKEDEADNGAAHEGEQGEELALRADGSSLAPCHDVRSEDGMLDQPLLQLRIALGEQESRQNDERHRR